MIDTANYLVTREIAERSGRFSERYRTQDGRYILSSRDLAAVKFTSDEYITGLKGIEKITTEEARTLAAKGGFKKGDAL